jgi:hypothetical protein
MLRPGYGIVIPAQKKRRQVHEGVASPRPNVVVVDQNRPLFD